ncbi:IS1595 family transposase [Erythrobacteraceae bacterium CFH 75059]|uniref:IS1595 family transposase n=1 Tax=Qipengyuania thermophila TaxID=2509361 RepID=UPI001022A093|nr:IS1595 family transposase [Qipengyuania thermophila]TCD00643.1 IS1595 family transposase [Erythrobacteraceae bacterium CFH 75059]
MNLLTIFKRFPDQEACIEFLEMIRWGDEAHCPHCGSPAVARKSESGRIGRWNCHACTNSFNVLSGTIFEKTRIPLQKWFLAIGLLINAKKSVSSCQLARDLDMNQKSAWYMQQRIRAAMLTEEGELLQGIVEIDETYVGGKPRKPNDHSGGGWGGFSGRGTKKQAVVGAVERGGRVVARMATEGVSAKALSKFIRATVQPFGTLAITDEWGGYSRLCDTMQHAVVRHRRQYADGIVHTNTIEGFWALVKRAWYGTHHRYSRRYMPLFIGEACWKYNNRKNADAFSGFLKGCFA